MRKHLIPLKRAFFKNTKMADSVNKKILETQVYNYSKSVSLIFFIVVSLVNQYTIGYTK